MIEFLLLKQYVRSVCCFLTSFSSGARSPRAGSDMISVLHVADWRTDNLTPKAVIGRLIRKDGFARIAALRAKLCKRLVAFFAGPSSPSWRKGLWLARHIKWGCVSFWLSRLTSPPIHRPRNPSHQRTPETCPDPTLRAMRPNSGPKLPPV